VKVSHLLLKYIGTDRYKIYKTVLLLFLFFKGRICKKGYSKQLQEHECLACRKGHFVQRIIYATVLNR